MAFPGDVDRAKVAGCLALLRDGATLVRDAGDVLEALGLRTAPARAAPGRPSLDPEESALLAALDDGEVAFDALRARLHIEPGRLAARLVALELSGHVTPRGGGRYARAVPR